jgi:hypothetical protein
MTEYTVTVDGYVTGLTASALQSQIEDQFPQQTVDVQISESE